jgi:hypothetical protein
VFGYRPESCQAISTGEYTMPRNTTFDRGDALIGNEPSSQDADSRPREIQAMDTDHVVAPASRGCRGSHRGGTADPFG